MITKFEHSYYIKPQAKLIVEKDFIEKCREGDKAALEKLYYQLAPKMKGVCLRYAMSDFDSEDIFQEGFIKVFKNLKSYNYQGPFDAWIKRIFINCAIDHFKKNIHLKKIESIDKELFVEIEDEHLEILSQLSANEIHRIMQTIPSGYYLVLNLFAIEGYSHAEIAQMLNISESTSRSQLSRARNFLKIFLEKH